MSEDKEIASIIIPAHNEERVIQRLLSALSDSKSSFETFVVCNGCTDQTAEVVRQIAPDVKVVELPQASKREALIAGDHRASKFPRVYIDADVVIDASGVRALVAALEEPGVLAVAPERNLNMTGASWPVRAYHEIWQRLPAVREGLYGRGVLAVSSEGFRRIANRPPVIGDDLHVHHTFSAAERRIVRDATSHVRTAQTVRSLIPRRTRATIGNTEMTEAGGHQIDTTRTSAGSLPKLIAHNPTLLPHATVFVAVTVIARARARRLRNTPSLAWFRDESSRA